MCFKFFSIKNLFTNIIYNNNICILYNIHNKQIDLKEKQNIKFGLKIKIKEA